MDATQVAENGIMKASLSIENFLDLGVCIALAAIGIYLIRPAKRAEIIAVWDKKWKRIEK